MRIPPRVLILIATVFFEFWSVTPSDAQGRIPLFRYNNPRPEVLDHFYTGSFSEIGCGANGWWYEGTIGELLAQPQTGTTALYRYWNGDVGDHFYTINPFEISGPNGYVFEGVVGYVFLNPVPGTIELERWYNGDPKVIDHLYTTNPIERPAGYTKEGNAGFIFPPSAPQAPCPRSDLTIGEVSPVQAVYNAALILGKSTAYRVRVDASACIELGLFNGPIDVSVVQDGVTYSASVTYGDFNIRTNGVCSAFVHVLAGVGPSHVGTSAFQVRVDRNAIVNEGNFGNNFYTGLVDVVQTPNLSVVYVPFGGCEGLAQPSACYGPVFNPETDVKRHDDFIRAVFPLSEHGYSSSISEPFYGSPISTFGIGSVEDVLNVAVWGKRSNPQATKVVGLIPLSYLTYHGYPSDVTGLTYFFGAALVAENTNTTVAHELGHQFGLHRGIEEYRFADPGNPAPGYWVNGGKEFLATSAACFMGREPIQPPLSSGERWIDASDYAQLTAAMTAGADPASILVTGFLNANGTVDLRSSYFLANAVTSASDPTGNLVVTVRDALGAELSQTAVFVPLVQIVEPFGEQPAPRVPFAVTVAYPPDADRVDIAKADGTLLATVVPSSKLLLDALAAVPNAGFVKNPEERRKALRNMIEASNHMVDAGNTLGAARKLRGEISERIGQWIQADYDVSPLQMSRTELLAVLDELAARLLAGGR